jgi:hypothetical protein
MSKQYNLAAEIRRLRAVESMILSLVNNDLEELPQLPKRLDEMTETERTIAHIACDLTGSITCIKRWLMEAGVEPMSTLNPTGKKYEESWEEYCQRKTSEAQDSTRLYRGMIAIVPMLRALPEVGSIDRVLDAMAICTYADARKELIRWLRGNWDSDSVTPILRAFDIHSI